MDSADRRRRGKGTVYWITGLSGAGKTTIGKLFTESLQNENQNVVMLDGDLLREVYGNDLGYSKEDRQLCAMRHARLCKVLSDQGIDVVCATISMFHACRSWNRKNIAFYCEIYLKVSLSVLHQRNSKGLYGKDGTGICRDLVGVTEAYEEPIEPDLTILNDGEKSPEQVVEIIRAYLRPDLK